VRPQSPIDEGPAAFPECIVIRLEDGSLHPASVRGLKLLTSSFTPTIGDETADRHHAAVRLG
jgi:hypothetical protein